MGQNGRKDAKFHLTNLSSQRKGLIVEKGTQFRRAGRGLILAGLKTKPVSSKDLIFMIAIFRTSTGPDISICIKSELTWKNICTSIGNSWLE